MPQRFQMKTHAANSESTQYPNCFRNQVKAAEARAVSSSDFDRSHGQAYFQKGTRHEEQTRAGVLNLTSMSLGNKGQHPAAKNTVV